MIITYVMADSFHELNTSIYRAVRPVEAINKLKDHQAFLIHINDFESNANNARFVCSKSDVIIIERNLKGDVLKLITEWRSLGKVVIANFDDAYQVMPPSNVSYSYWQEGKIKYQNEKGEVVDGILTPTPIVVFEEALKLCNAIITPSAQLSKDWEHCAPSYKEPNYFNIGDYIDIIKQPHEGTFIGWGGSMSHLQSWQNSGILDALRKICNERKDVKLFFCGDPNVFALLPVSEKQKQFQGYVPYAQWPSVVSNFDIGLAPLAGAYDMRRSWIKPMEYMLLKTPWVASDNGAYDQIRTFGHLVKNYRREWYKAINEILEDRNQTQIDSAYSFACEYSDVDRNIMTTIELFKKIAKDSGIEIS